MPIEMVRSLGTRDTQPSLTPERIDLNTFLYEVHPSSGPAVMPSPTSRGPLQEELPLT